MDYEDRVYFQCLQGGKTLTGFGTPTKSESIKMANGKAAIEVVPNDSEMNLIMEIRNQDFKGSYLTIKK